MVCTKKFTRMLWSLSLACGEFLILNYLKITGLKVGLIINFKHAKLEWKRVALQ